MRGLTAFIQQKTLWVVVEQKLQLFKFFYFDDIGPESLLAYV